MPWKPNRAYRSDETPLSVEGLALESGQRLHEATGKPVTVYRRLNLYDWDRELPDGSLIECNVTYFIKFSEANPPNEAVPIREWSHAVPR